MSKELVDLRSEIAALRKEMNEREANRTRTRSNITNWLWLVAAFLVFAIGNYVI